MGIPPHQIIVQNTDVVRQNPYFVVCLRHQAPYSVLAVHRQYLRGSSGIARMLRRRQRGLECPTVMSLGEQPQIFETLVRRAVI